MGLVPLSSSPGIQRDGTILASTCYTDGQWCRFQRGLPRKIGGCKVIQPYSNGLYRALFSQAQSGLRYFNAGHQTGMDTFTIDNFGVCSAPFQPTFPATTNPTTAGVVTGPLVNWQFDSQFDNASGNMLLFAFANQNLLDPTNGANFPLYSMNVYNPAAGVTQVQGFGSGSDGHGGTQQALFPNGISGGIVSLAPYLCVYGNNGFFAWSAPGFPTDFTGTSQGSLFVGATEITNQKILRGLPLRGGGGYSPAGLFWSVDSLVRANFIGISNGTWQFDQLTTQSSLLSPNCVIENDGTFFWAGVDRFLMFNGQVQEIPNSQNLNWFFDNINQANAAKSFVMKVPRYGEIWWCYPRGTSTECNAAVIYNYRERTWYDTSLLDSGRSAGLHADNLVGNLMAGINPYTSSVTGSPTTYYDFWEHETGYDEINGSNIQAIDSWFTTAAFTNYKNQQGAQPNAMSVETLEPDFIQTGDMTVSVLKQNNARAPVLTGTVATIKDPLTVQGTYVPGQTPGPLNQIVPLKDTAKILRFKVESNTVGGTYQAGMSMLNISPDADSRST
jgi:hypothetical protein